MRHSCFLLLFNQNENIKSDILDSVYQVHLEKLFKFSPKRLTCTVQWVFGLSGSMEGQKNKQTPL